MGQFIVKLEGKYLVWSTVVDAPLTFGMTREELTDWIREEEGAEGVRALPERMMRVDASGTSAFRRLTPEEVMRTNRAGPRETCISIDEIAERWVRTEKGRDG